MGFVRAHPSAGVVRLAPLLLLGLLAAWPGQRAVAAAAADDSAEGDLGVLPAPEVAKFVLDGDNLVVETGLTPGAGQRDVQIAGLPGEASVYFSARTRQREPRAILYFSLNHSSTRPGGQSCELSVVANGTTMVLSRTLRSPRQFHTVSLRQTRYRWNGDGDGTVQLSVRSTRSDTGQVVDDVDVSAGNMAELLREHPAECVEFLGPVLHDFGGQDASLLGVSRPLAWQVLGDLTGPEEALDSRVDALLARLNDGDYRARQRAARELIQIGGPAASLLRDRPREALSAEQHAWVDKFVDDYRPLPAEQVQEMRRDRNFLVRCFVFSVDRPIRRAAAEQLAKLTDKSPDLLDANGDLDARLKALGRLRGGATSKP